MMNSTPIRGSAPGLAGTTLRLIQIGAILAAVGLTLTLIVPILNLRSSDCGSLNCGLVQTIGKASTSVGVLVIFATAAITAARTRNFSGAVLAALIAFPAAVLAVGVVVQWQQLQAGSDRITPMLARARDFAASQNQSSPSDIKTLLVTGKGDWAVVRVSQADRMDEFVLLIREGSEWRPRAMARTFTKNELARLEAPTDLMRDADVGASG